ncbi:hypothetical protein DM80_1475 [Burkholderia multivorans]|nr:hypothetical protein DM80_1475 [Burkholderia multivorans]
MKKALYLIILVLAIASIIGLGVGILVELDRLFFSGARSGIPSMAVSLPSLIVTIAALRGLGNHVTAKLERQVQRVASAGFHPTVEASVAGRRKGAGDGRRNGASRTGGKTRIRTVSRLRFFAVFGNCILRGIWHRFRGAVTVALEDEPVGAVA